jgi:hypothetical protein
MHLEELGSTSCHYILTCQDGPGATSLLKHGTLLEVYVDSQCIPLIGARVIDSTTPVPGTNVVLKLSEVGVLDTFSGT